MMTEYLFLGVRLINTFKPLINAFNNVPKQLLLLNTKNNDSITFFHSCSVFMLQFLQL